MLETTSNAFPTGVRVIAALFALCGLFLAVSGLVILLRPGTISMTVAAPLLFGLELAGPYMFLLTAAIGGAIAWGLARTNNLARHAAVLAAIAGIVMLVPPTSAAAVMVQPKSLALDGLAIIVRVIVAWYLSQGHIAQEFKRPR